MMTSITKQTARVTYFILWNVLGALAGMFIGFFFPSIVLRVTVDSWFDDPLAWVVGGAVVGLLTSCFTWKRMFQG